MFNSSSGISNSVFDDRVENNIGISVESRYILSFISRKVVVIILDGSWTHRQVDHHREVETDSLEKLKRYQI
jgi:hypothetical protein